MTAPPRIITLRRRERLFYLGMAVAILTTVFAGFSRSYFLKARFDTPELSLLLHVHGLIFTSWILLFLAQTTLVAARRTDIHRRLGALGGVLAALLVIVGTTTAIIRVKAARPRCPEYRPWDFWRSRSSTWWCLPSGGGGLLLPPPGRRAQAPDDPRHGLAAVGTDRPAALRAHEGGAGS